MTAFPAGNAFTAICLSLAAIFLLREYFTYRNRIPLKYLLTPLVTAMNAGLVILSVYSLGMSDYRLLVLLAMIFSLIADVMLMVVEVSLILYGIIYFFVAHILYISAFSMGYAFIPWHAGLGVAIASVFMFFDYMIGRGAGKYRLEAFLYSAALGSMAFFAFSPLFASPDRNALIRAAGALLFIISDTCMATNAFRKPLRHSSVITWATYGPAQFLFALSCF
jgi:uncharacterized membrane protein YhhN